jgi:NAD(P)H-hydrate epimerase
MDLDSGYDAEGHSAVASHFHAIHVELEPFRGRAHDTRMKVCTIHEMHAIEARAISEIGLAPATLTETAALAACRVLRTEPQFPTSLPVVVVCGPGPKGTTGLAVARQLHANGRSVKVVSIGPADGSDEQRDAFDVTVRCGVPCSDLANPDDFSRELPSSAIVVDALLGPEPDVSAPIARAIDTIGDLDLPVLSLAIPSGVCGDTGRVAGSAIRARATIAFGLPLRGNLVPPGASLGGRLYVTHMSLPPHVLHREEIQVELVQPDPLPPRLAHGHKGTFGDTLFIAGAGTYYGAPGLAAMASLRSGAGYARLACPASMIPTLATFAPEVVFVPQHETEAATLALDNAPALISLANQVGFVVIGPGISLHADTQALVRDILLPITQPVLIDGDGLSAIADHADVVRRRQAPTILTPHPGEMARLLGTSTRQVLDGPIESARRAASLLQSIVVLKGSHSIVALPNGHVTLNTSGNDGMGTAGSGDVLAGTIAAMSGLGLSPHGAVRTGVFLHGLAGDMAMRELGADGMTARDILARLPEAVRTYRQSRAELLQHHHGTCTAV